MTRLLQFLPDRCLRRLVRLAWSGFDFGWSGVFHNCFSNRSIRPRWERATVPGVRVRVG